MCGGLLTIPLKALGLIPRKNLNSLPNALTFHDKILDIDWNIEGL